MILKQFFVPVEFSDKSSIGVELAVLIAGKEGSVVHMIHSIGSDKRYNERKFLNNKIAYTAKIIQKLINYYRRRTNDEVKFDFSIVRDDLYNQILAHSKSNLGSSISIGLQYESGLLTRSNVQKIINSSVTPVFTASKALPPTVSNIVLPLDLSPETKIKVPHTASIAKLFNAKVHILGINTSSEDKKTLELYSNQVSNYFEEEGISYTKQTLSGGNIVDMILYYTERVCADFISIVSRQDKGLYAYLLSNYASNIVQKAPVPVMLIPLQTTGSVQLHPTSSENEIKNQ
ncbi:MAG: universal stress protein [Bacteroidales bacterium]|nr:universal stress protein [Bacteroidales bacterium]